MLSTLIPGLRHLRAPVAAGYVWLIAIYLALAPVMPEPDQATGVYADVYDLAASVGPAAALAASAFVAYLIGLLSADLSRALVVVATRTARGIGGGHRWAGNGNAELSSRGWSAALAISEERVLRIESVLRREAVSSEEIEESIPIGRSIARDDPLHVLCDIAELSEQDVRRDADLGGPALGLTERLMTDLRLSKLRLLEKSPEVFEEVDRTESEAETRLAVVPPLIALVLVLAFTSSAFWLVGALPVLMLFHQGVQRRQERGDQLIDAVSVGTIEPPELERLSKVLGEVIEEVHQRRRGPVLADVRE